VIGPEHEHELGVEPAQAAARVVGPEACIELARLHGYEWQVRDTDGLLRFAGIRGYHLAFCSTTATQRERRR
jgi:hypothetical protein